MAGRTSDGGMRSSQGEIAHGAMIEAGLGPIRHRMTARAVAAQTAFVNVVAAMAAVTGCVAFGGEVVSGMAGVTGQSIVTSNQGKTGQPKVIEFQ